MEPGLLPFPFPHPKAVAMTAASSRRSFLRTLSATAAAPLLGQFLDVESAFGTVPSSVHAAKMRVSPNLMNTQEELDRLLGILVR